MGLGLIVYGRENCIIHFFTRYYSLHKGNLSLNQKTLNSIPKGSGLSPEARNGRDTSQGYSPVPTKRVKQLKVKTTFRSFFSSGEPIRTTDLRVMSQNPESVPFVRRALQISRPDELWSTLAGHAAVANRYSYSICFTWVRQVLFLAFLHSSFQFNLFKSIFSWGMRPP